ncbi:hypothetical protein ACTXT7_006425 [Hymenolepis weldensis]
MVRYIPVKMFLLRSTFDGRVNIFYFEETDSNAIYVATVAMDTVFYRYVFLPFYSIRKEEKTNQITILPNCKNSATTR